MKNYFNTENLYTAIIIISLFVLLFIALTIINQFITIF